MTALLARVRRRHLVQVILEQAGIAAGAAFAGIIVLLLVGTQILDWYWLAVVFGGSFAIGLWLTIRRIPGRYRLAQIADQRLGFHDTISTAIFYGSGQRPADPKLIAYQSAQAETLARTADPAAVVPLRMPKALYAVAGMALVAFGMFAIRYGVTHSLDLKPSLVRIAFDRFFQQDERAAIEKKNPLDLFKEQLKKMGLNVGSSGDQPKDQNGTDTNSTMEVPNTQDARSGDSAKATPANSPKDQQPGEGSDGEKAERASGDPQKDGQDPNSEMAQGVTQDGKQDRGDQNDSNKSNLMDRMRDAMANLLNKMKMQSKSGQGQQQASKNSQNSGKGQQSESQKSTEMAGKPQSNGSQSPDQQGQQQGQGDRPQNAQGRSGDKMGDHQPSQDAKSGIGKDDGDKSAKEAAQLAAMGKISEILGKRAQNLTGELMVEVSGGKQQLKTGYSGQVGNHAESGGEITRDEVPLAYREYVQQYFEQVRKLPPTSGKSKAAETGGKKSGKAAE